MITENKRTVSFLRNVIEECWEHIVFNSFNKKLIKIVYVSVSHWFGGGSFLLVLLLYLMHLMSVEYSKFLSRSLLLQRSPH